MRALRVARALALVLALAGQVGAGALAEAPRPPESARALLNAAMVLCLGGNHTDKNGVPPAHHHLPGPAMAASCHHLVQPPAILGDVETLPAAPAQLAVWTGLPETRGPPSRDNTAFYPTGPPA